jgi:hypothetical protein
MAWPPWIRTSGSSPSARVLFLLIPPGFCTIGADVLPASCFGKLRKLQRRSRAERARCLSCLASSLRLGVQPFFW